MGPEFPTGNELQISPVSCKGPDLPRDIKGSWNVLTKLNIQRVISERLIVEKNGPLQVGTRLTFSKIVTLG